MPVRALRLKDNLLFPSADNLVQKLSMPVRALRLRFCGCEQQPSNSFVQKLSMPVRALRPVGGLVTLYAPGDIVQKLSMPVRALRPSHIQTINVASCYIAGVTMNKTVLIALILEIGAMVCATACFGFVIILTFGKGLAKILQYLRKREAIRAVPEIRDILKGEKKRGR